MRCLFTPHLHFKHVVAISSQSPEDVARDLDLDLVSSIVIDGLKEAVDGGGGRRDVGRRHGVQTQIAMKHFL